MKCSNCGGELIFKDNIGVCSSCGSNHKIDNAFENTEVCICYIENDVNGRRTKDSIISAEIYKKLESKKISTFYEHISAANVIGDDIETLRYTAIVRAKIIVLVGTSTENFASLYKKFDTAFDGKKIIPVISDMKPEQLPEEFRHFQASNFDAIGSLNNLLISVLNLLGRGKEVELEEIYNKKAKKKKTIATILISMLAAIVCIAAILAIVFWPEKEEPVILTNNDIYNSAVSLLNEGKYLEAATEFNKIADYKDSSNQFKKIYDRYDGYYQDDGQTCSLYLNIVDGKTAEVSFEKIISNKVIKIEESMVISDNNIKGKYVDSLSNEGDISIVLTNEKVQLTVSTANANTNISIGEFNIDFEIKNKTDRPQIKTINKDVLLSWMKNSTSVEDIKTAGYELEYIDTSGPYDESFGTQYKIANTDITIIATNMDLTQYKGQENWDFPELENDVVVAVITPVTLMCPEKIGQSSCVFSEDGLAYVLNASHCLYNSNGTFSFSLHSSGAMTTTTESLLVSKDRYVGVSSKKLIGEYNYAYLIKENEEIYYKTAVLQQHQKDNPDSPETHIETHILAENDKAILINVHTRKLDNGLDSGENGSFNYYRFDLTTQKSSLITKHNQVSYINSYGSRMYSYDDWKNYPELFGEFL